MPTNIVESENHVTAKEIEEFETLIAHTLPDDYKIFLLKHNGGCPEPAGFRFSLTGNKWDIAIIAWFLALYEGEAENISSHYSDYKDRIPSDTLAIARDPGGSLILTGIENKNKGKIFFWLSELEGDDGEPPTYNNVAFVANSFNEFFDSLADIE